MSVYNGRSGYDLRLVDGDMDAAGDEPGPAPNRLLAGRKPPRTSAVRWDGTNRLRVGAR